MIRKLGDVISFDFITKNPQTNIPQNADVLPTCEVFVEDSDTPIHLPIVFQRSLLTATYRVSFQTSAANGFVKYKNYSCIIDATVDGDAVREVIGQFYLEENGIDDMYQLLRSSGKNIVGFKLLSDSSQIVNDAYVYVYSLGGLLITFGISDQSGNYTTLLGDGTYNAFCYKSGQSFAAFDFDITGSTDFIITGEGVQITAPSPSEACRVYEFCFSPNGLTPAPSVSGSAVIISVPTQDDGKLIVYDTVAGTYDPNTGEIYWDLVRGAKVQFKIPDLRLSVTKTIPDVSGIRLTDI